ncbi:MAG TPA: translesion DNA synthesis-associated protein ImuA [Steroidobacteraceae bacterium]|jgi:hypothetical protein
MDPTLQNLPNVWRAESLSAAPAHPIPSGHAQLDAALGGGWPSSALVELLTDQEGIGELQLLLPILRYFRDERRTGLVLWLNPPYIPHALALLQHGIDPACHWVGTDLSPRDAGWAMELGLKSTACDAVIGWLPQVTPTGLRRIKLASASAQTFAVIFRPLAAARSPSPATVRATLTAEASRLRIDLLKVQGRRQCTVTIDVDTRIDAVLP